MANETVQKTMQPAAWTPSLHGKASTLKVTKLLELGESEKGRFARVEFDDESSRPLYLLSIADAWHPVFNSLNYLERRKIREHFNNHLSPIRLSDDCIKTFRDASFITDTRTKRGKYLGSNNFDTAAYEGKSGTQTGLRIAREFLELLAVGAYPANLGLTLKGIFAATDKKGIEAGYAFCYVMNDMLQFAASRADFNSYIDGRIESDKESEKYLNDLKAKQKAEFVTRMKAAREAKRNAKAESHHPDEATRSESNPDSTTMTEPVMPTTLDDIAA